MPTVTTIRIGGGHHVDIPVDVDDPFGLLPVWKRWMRIRNIMATRPGTAPLVRPLTNAKPVGISQPPAPQPPPPPARPDYALIPALDQWGNQQALPGHNDEGLSTSAVLAVVNTHLHGRGRGITRRDDWVQRVLDRTAPESSDEPEPVIVPALPDHHNDGVQARKRAMEVFDGIDDTFADIDRRTAELLERTEQILNGLD